MVKVQQNNEKKREGNKKKHKDDKIEETWWWSVSFFSFTFPLFVSFHFAEGPCRVKKKNALILFLSLLVLVVWEPC